MNWIKENWFKVGVIILLIMIFTRLGKIKDNTFYTADMVDSSISKLIDSSGGGDFDLSNIESYLDEMNENLKKIGGNTANSWYTLQSINNNVR